MLILLHFLYLHFIFEMKIPSSPHLLNLNHLIISDQSIENKQGYILRYIFCPSYRGWPSFS